MKTQLFFLVFLCFGNVMAQEIDRQLTVIEFQKKLNEHYADAATSPLTPNDLQAFQSLEFFPVDEDFTVVAEFVRTPYETPFVMPTTTEREPLYVKYGEIYFELKGGEFKLNIYQNLELTTDPEYHDYLFLPFTDLSNGTTSYAGGRYLDLRIPEENKIVIDFNQAYNPYCAYNGKYSCPIPPEENHVDIEIPAGVRKFTP